MWNTPGLCLNYLISISNPLARVPPNCHFEITDFESEWEFRKPFDYIHGRNIGGSVHDLPLLLNRIKNNLNNNGWVEFVDFYAEAFSDDNSLERAPYVVEWCQLVDKASVQFGKQVNIAPCLKQSMIDAGFKNVTEEIYKVCRFLYTYNSVICTYTPSQIKRSTTYVMYQQLTRSLGSCKPLGQGS